MRSEYCSEHNLSFYPGGACGLCQDLPEERLTILEWIMFAAMIFGLGFLAGFLCRG